LTHDVRQPGVVLRVLAGQGSFRDGGDGKDTVIKVPVGTIIRRKDAEVMKGGGCCEGLQTVLCCFVVHLAVTWGHQPATPCEAGVGLEQ
jgi:hypothetical protein